MSTIKNHPRARRGFLSGALASLVGCVFAKRAEAAEESDVLRRRVRQGDPPAQPLDTMVLFERGDESHGRAMTHEVLSLIHEEKGKNSYPWTLYTSLATHHENGDACCHCARLHKHGPGWSTGIHSEVFNHGRAVALGVNIEMSNDYTGSEPTQVYGLNIQAVSGPMQYGIHIHDKDERAGFATGIGVNGRGKVGVDLSGNYDVGLHTHGNNIRLGEGACVELDDDGKVKLRYRDGKIEFLNGDKRVAYIDMNGSDHAI